MRGYLRQIIERYRDPFRNRPNWAEKTMLIITVGIALVYAGQYGQMKSSSQQTADLIKYAKAQACAAQKIADASHRNAAAAESFSQSASGINVQTKNAAQAMTDQVTKLQESNKLTQRALDNSKRQFEQDQRPLIWSSSIIMIPLKGGTSEKIKFDIFFANYGKSPAVSFIGRGKIFVGPYSLQRAERWIRDLGKERFGDTYIGGTTVVMPGIPADPSKPVGGYATIQSDMLMSEQIKDALARDDYIVVVDRQQYFDIAGNFYWSDMCWTHLATGATKACPHNNEVH